MPPMLQQTPPGRPGWSAMIPASLRALARTFRRGVPALLDQARDRTDLLMLEARLSPVDLYLAQVRVARHTGLHHPSYLDWRARRIEKMLELYGVEFFAGKRVLELGCGHGDIGAFFADLGAEVLGVDGRVRNINHAKLKHRNCPRLSFQLADLEQDFTALGRFDLVINFGLLYHLRQVDAHLACCFGMADEIVLESVVCDSLDPHRILLRPEQAGVDEEALHGIGSRPSPFYVERLAHDAGLEIERHFTADLNSADHFRYDWVHRDDGAAHDDFGKRRFWRFTRKQVRLAAPREAAASTPPADRPRPTRVRQRA